MSVLKDVLLTIGDDVIICKCNVTYDEFKNVENVRIVKLFSTNTASKEGIDISGIKSDLVIEARLKQLVTDILK